MTTCRRLFLHLALLLVGAGVSVGAHAGEGDPWAGYLDYAYVYSSAEPDALRSRLAGYGRETGITLERYITEEFEGRPSGDGPIDEARTRRKAIAHLLHYLASAEPESLERSVDAIRELDDHLGRHENRYWHHYILAHRALEKGRHHDFVGEILELWLVVVVPLEAPYETLQKLSLSEAPNSGFASALPFIYENVSRIVLLRSQQMGMTRGLDPLGAIVRLLYDGRVGAHPEVIPLAASSRDYLQRIVQRLDGPESDAGSLTFTLTLFEASKYHDEARALLASEGLNEATLEATRVATGAYQAALDRADTVQGRCAVYTRVLRQLGEIYAAKQRLGVDPEVETPFRLEGAIDVYATLHTARGGWESLGYAATGRQSYVDAMHGLWEEIQEAHLNIADYYLARSSEEPERADEHARNAARLLGRYLGFFLEYATVASKGGVPESAYFAAHEAARGTGDAFLLYAVHPAPEEIDLAIRRYHSAIRLFPFDRRVWSSLTGALERQGRESRYMEMVAPAAEAVTRSRAVDRWIGSREPEAERIATLRRAFSESLALVYLGFAEETGVAELEASVVALHAEGKALDVRLEGLKDRIAGSGRSAVPASLDPETDAPAALDAAALAALHREVAETSTHRARVQQQIEARARALPLYKATLRTDGLAAELRARRDHPVHTLLRRMYYEDRNEPEGEQE